MTIYEAKNRSDKPAGVDFNSRILVLDIVDISEPRLTWLCAMELTGLIARRSK